ncbi:S8 family serine peptidase [Candidatus Magnetominusculus dajiuhuensis]|uniref:S8 family serine peptidase n=1 Tax=Candidatus Magnetominusculus dajiuhuensis TaxID=3137712 RepID=UPI003B42E8AA
MKSWKQKKRAVSFVFLLLTVFCLSSLAPLTVSAGELSASLKSKVSSDGGYEKLASQAERKGSIRIIVTVNNSSNTSFRPMGGLSAPEEKAQMAAISRAQEQVMAQLSSVNVISYYKYQYIPHIAMTVDRNALDAVLAITGVSSVEEDKLSRPTGINWNITKVGASTAWANGYDGTGYTVAILDTGVDKTHPMLTGKVASEACYSSNDNESSVATVCPGGVDNSTASGSAMPYAGNCPTGECDHGTHVAGIAAGLTTDNSSGVAKGANIIAIQVFSRIDDNTTCEGSSPCTLSYTSDQLKGLERVYALKNTYSIASANMSLGGGWYGANCDNDSRKAAIDNLRSAGIATVISSGNSKYPDGMGAPGCISTAVSVGATDSSDNVSSYSNSASFLNLLAPGSAITSAVPNGGYATWNGTSMAAPHVAGAWAVLKQAKPTASVTDILSALTSTGVSVTDSRNGISKPRIQVALALNALIADYSLYVTKYGTGTGTISSSPSGISCGTTCLASYAAGTSVTLTAAANSSSTFTGWTGCDSASGSQCTVAMVSSKTVTATFTATTSSTYTLNVSKSGTGTGTITSSPSGISCGSACSSSYASGTSVMLTATTDNGSTFTSWSGCDSTTNNYCDVTMSSAKSVTAVFTAAGSDYTDASTAINTMYSQYASWFGSKSGSIATGTFGSSTYYVQWFSNGAALVAWTDGYMYTYYNNTWYSLGVSWQTSNDLAKATAKINAVYAQYASWFGSKVGSVLTGTSGPASYYVQWFSNGTALVAWTDGNMYTYYVGTWYALGVTWK